MTEGRAAQIAARLRMIADYTVFRFQDDQAVLREAADLLAALPPAPTETTKSGWSLSALSTYFGWGLKDDHEVFKFVIYRENLLRLAQSLLETQKSNAATAEEAITERVEALRASALPPVRETTPEPDKCQTCQLPTLTTLKDGSRYCLTCLQAAPPELRAQIQALRDEIKALLELWESPTTREVLNILAKLLALFDAQEPQR